MCIGSTNGYKEGTGYIKLSKEESLRLKGVDNRKEISVDKCIKDEVEYLIRRGVITLGSCCGHRETNKQYEFKRGDGKALVGETTPPHCLVHKDSTRLCEQLGYRVYPYYYKNELAYTRVIYLKTGELN